MKTIAEIFIAILVLFLVSAAGICASSESADNLNFANQFLNNEEIVLKVADSEETVGRKEFIQWVTINPVLICNAKFKAEAENIYYCPVNPLFCELTKTRRQRLHLEKKYQATAKEDEIKSFLDDLGRKINKDSVDAKFQIEDGHITVFSLSQDGLKLNTEESAKIIADIILKGDPTSQNSKKGIILKYVNLEPEISSESVGSLGVTSLVGEGRSNFRGSPKNRVFNIKVGSNRFNGALIKPNEEFSFVSILGPVDGEHGYLPELVIKKDKTEPEFGGGICQISTTAFRAAIYSGLKITARRNHAYPVRYYDPQGMDATVYIPRPDLRFINNTPSYILIQTKIEGTELVFDFYGTDDGRKIEIEGPKVLERNPDGSMKTTFTQKVYDKDKNLMINDTFKSAYDSPSKYPHPGEEKLTHKPDDWSKKQWEDYKKANGL
jgi:vancomycin resistance protein YoaR